VADYPISASQIHGAVTTTLSLFVAGESGLHRLNPITKLILSLALILGGFAIPNASAGYLIFIGIILPLSVWGKIWKEMINSVIKTVLPFAISIFLIQSLFWGEGTTLLAIGPLTVQKEGIDFSIASVGRIILVVGSFLLLVIATRPDALMNALNNLGIPGTITYIVITTIQIIPRFQAKAATIVDAQRSRGLLTEGNILVRVRALLPLVMPLVLSSIVDVEERAIALEARAFNAPGKKTSLIEINDSRTQRVVRWTLIIITLILIGYRIWP
jgi:energy-coupling factor transport system permease protein